MPDVTHLEKKFNDAMMHIYVAAKEDLRYNAVRYLQMLQDLGGLETARVLLASTTVSDGYTKLWMHKRLDLTVEALVVKPEFASLFSVDERNIAARRLQEYGFMS